MDIIIVRFRNPNRQEWHVEVTDDSAVYSPQESVIAISGQRQAGDGATLLGVFPVDAVDAVLIQRAQ